MANDPKYGGSKGDLDAAVAATNAQAAKSLENKARAARDAEKAQDGESRAEDRNRGARKASAAEIERQSAALEATTSRLAAETAAVNASTEAWLRNAKARGAAGGEALAGARYAGGVGDLSGAIAATEQQARAVENLDQKAQALQRTGRQLDLFGGTGTTGLFGRQPANAITGTPPRLRELDFKDPASQSRLSSAFQFAGATPPAARGAATKALSEYSAAEAHAAEVGRVEAATIAESNRLFQESVGAYAASSQALQRHGALTAEFVQGLIRGEVTLKEFQSQLVITIGKFAGWAVAGGLVYGAYDAIKHVFDGVKETQSGVEQLRRALGEKVNAPAAAEGFQKVAVETNSSIREVADAQFYSARVFHDQADSLALAGTALRAYRLDQVNAQDAIKAFAAINVSFAAGPKEIADAFDKLDVGQLKFNARLQQTLPQVGRAAASFSAAGGTLKQLVDQVIQINRATGGGGGTGGGNPATALLREPANLYRPESEEVLRRYGFNPRHAQTNVGTFNQEVQEQIHSGRLDTKAAQDLAKAAGAGAGVGFRYLLPLFQLGRGNIPTEEREATAHAGGSAQADLQHRLAQADEQLRRLGIDFEVFGLKLASAGIGPVLNDTLSVLDLVARGVGLLIEPFALLGSALTKIPGPLRDILEAAVAYKAVQVAGRSGVGLAARSLAAESSLLPTYAGGGAPELRALQTTQRKYLDFLNNQRETQGVSRVTTGLRTKEAAGSLEAFRAAGPAGSSREAQAAYYEREQVLESQLYAAQQAQRDAATAGKALETEINSVKARLLVLENKRLSVAERLAAAQAEGLYAAQLGAPNALPLLAPHGGVSSGGVVLPAGSAAARDAEATAAATATTATTAETEAASVVATSRYAQAGSAVRSAAGAIGGAFTGLRTFLSGLGLLGKGVAAFVALEALNQLDGANRDFTEGAARIDALQNPSSESGLRDQLAKVRPGLDTGSLISAAGELFEGKPGHEIEFAKATGHDFLQAIIHPQHAIEDAFGAEHPGTFTFDQRAVERRLADKQRKRLGEGKLKGLGQNQALSAQSLEVIEGQEYEATSGLEAGQSDKTIEGIQQKVAAQIKLRLDEFKAFGAGTGYGAQSIQRLTASLNSLAAHYVQGGQTLQFEELAKDSEAVVQGVVSTVSEHVQQAAKFSSSEAERATALAGVHAQVQQAIRALARPLTVTSEEITADQGSLGTYQTALKGSTDPSKRKDLQKKIDELRKRLADLRNRYGQYRELYSQNAEKLQKLEEAGGQELLSSAEAQISAKVGVQKARAGADKQAGAEAELKGIIERQSAAKRLLKEGQPKAEALAGLEEKRIAAEESVVTEKIASLRAHGAREIAELPIGDNKGKANLEVEIDRRVEQAIRTSNLTPQSKHKQLEEAVTATLTAKKQAAEAIYQEALAVSNIQTQIAQAEHVGDAAAQAAAALVGAQKEAGLAQTPLERSQARLSTLNAINQARQAAQQRISDEAALAESQTTDPLAQARIRVGADRRLLGAAAGPDERIKAQTALNNDLNKMRGAQVSATEERIEFQKTMNQISSQTAIHELQGLLNIRGLGVKERESILTKIRALQNEIGVGNNKVFDLSPGKVKLPTAYDVNRAIHGATLGAQGAQLADNSTHSVVNHIVIEVHSPSDVDKVAEVLDKHTHAGVESRLKARGLVGGRRR